MPYSGPDDDSLPEDVRKRPRKEREAFVSTFNNVLERCMKKKGAKKKDCESSAFAIAYAAANDVAGKALEPRAGGEKMGKNQPNDVGADANKATIVRDRVSKRAWGDVDKTALGRRAAKMYAAGDITKAQVKEIYAFVPDEAFGRDADGKPEFQRSKAWGPHHELSAAGNIVLNSNGLAAAAGALGGARTGGAARLTLSGAEQASAKRHLRKHYRDDLKVKADDMPDSLKAQLLAGWKVIAEGREVPEWVEELVKILDGPTGVEQVAVVEEPVLPYGGAVSLTEIEEYRQAQERKFDLERLWWDLEMVIDNIGRREDIEDKGAAIVAAVEEFKQRVSSIKSVPDLEVLMRAVTRVPDIGTALAGLGPAGGGVSPPWAGRHRDTHPRRASPPGTAAGRSASRGPFIHVVEEPSVAVKSLGRDRLGGYLVLWGGPERRDLTREYFTPETAEMDAIFSVLRGLPGLYHHAMDRLFKSMVTGVVEVMEPDDVGLWIEEQLSLAKEYREALLEVLREGEKRGMPLCWSSGCLPGGRQVDEDGKIVRWPIVEASKTVAPAEFRGTDVRMLRKAYSDLQMDFEAACQVTQSCPRPGGEGAEEARQRALEAEKARLQLLRLWEG